MSRWVAIAAAVALVAALGGWRAAPWASAITSSGNRAIFEPLTPARILDTRAPSNPIGAAEARALQVTGAGGVAADATAVLLNVTAVSPTRAGFLTLYPADATRPTASNVNFLAGQVVPNSVTVKLSGGANPGRVLIYNSAGQTHVIVDVAGYYRGHDHNDLYYTKAQAQARTAANSLTCPAGSFLNTVAANGTPTCGVGAQGPAGPAGPPGPTASSFASHDPSDFELADSPGTQVISLRDGTSGSGGGDIVVPFSGRLFVSASLTVVTQSVLNSVFCRPHFARVGDPVSPMTAQPAQVDIEPNRRSVIAVVGSASVSPGTYYVAVICGSFTYGAGTRGKFQFGTLLAWAVAG